MNKKTIAWLKKASVWVEKLSWLSLLVKVAAHWLRGLGPNCSKQPCTCSCCCNHNSDLKSAQFQHNLLHLLVWNISFWKDGFCHVLCYLDTIGWLWFQTQGITIRLESLPMAKKPHPGQLNTQCAMYSACITVLNWGLGPHEDQTAEMVLI